MSIKKPIESNVSGMSEEESRQVLQNAYPADFHMRPGGRFATADQQRGSMLVEAPGEHVTEERRGGRSLLVVPDIHSMPTSGDVPDVKQELRRQQVLSDAFIRHLTERAEPGASSDVLRITWEEYMKIRTDEEFESFAAYSTDLLFYPLRPGEIQRQPRPRALRPVLTNEVGIWKGRILVLQDRGPGDPGEGKQHQVHANTPVQSKFILPTDGE